MALASRTRGLDRDVTRRGCGTPKVEVVSVAIASRTSGSTRRQDEGVQYFQSGSGEHGARLADEGTRSRRDATGVRYSQGGSDERGDRLADERFDEASGRRRAVLPKWKW